MADTGPASSPTAAEIIGQLLGTPETRVRTAAAHRSGHRRTRPGRIAARPGDRVRPDIRHPPAREGRHRSRHPGARPLPADPRTRPRMPRRRDSPPGAGGRTGPPDRYGRAAGRAAGRTGRPERRGFRPRRRVRRRRGPYCAQRGRPRHRRQLRDPPGLNRPAGRLLRSVLRGRRDPGRARRAYWARWAARTGAGRRTCRPGRRCRCRHRASSSAWPPGARTSSPSD